MYSRKQFGNVQQRVGSNYIYELGEALTINGYNDAFRIGASLILCFTGVQPLVFSFNLC